ncbi:phage-related protein [Enterobacter sp. BIGb0383]|uniref:type II toxin-antitoxin system RelE/ParE family toxin n=1 Tax=unclassified Enterobacter TaxID=2608935 RepID=UPI000F472286|nr:MULTISPECIES: type II toxin-antitoxin system RelE/ParE family toxin [unclassified Enterobacter]ROP60276.1 phage-related protein [Enterobacter sp. BIGb0383]ROS08257.1 phage-related protein [Enterobacter sp. BIGb0359]
MLSIRSVPKPIIWMGSSYEDLLAFPEGPRRQAGYQLHRIQAGLGAEDWKPMTEIGPGTVEIRLRDEVGSWRVFYLARLDEAIYILHCFNKKSQRTSGRDKAIGKSRYQAVMQHHRSHT